MPKHKWISEELLRRAAENYRRGERIEIIEREVEPCVATGDSYTSDILRVKVLFYRGRRWKPEELKLVIKCQEKGSFVEDWNNQLNSFPKEMEMFERTLPAMHRILGENMEGYLSSVCLHTTTSPTNMLVFEDLRPAGYVMHPRRRGFDLEHCEMVMRKIAAFHAASVIMVENDPSSVKNYLKGLYTPEGLSSDWIREGFKSLEAACLSTPELEIYGRKLQALGEAAVTRGIEASNLKPGFNVLNHGDMWVNNMLVSYEDNKLVDLKFVDLQLVKYTSPVIDLHYFYATSPSMDVMDQLDALLNIYYGHLISILAVLKYPLSKVPSRREFKRDFEERAFYGLMGLATVTPLVKASCREDATLEGLQKEGPEGFRAHCYSNKYFMGMLGYLMPYYDGLGILD